MHPLNSEGSISTLLADSVINDDAEPVEREGVIVLLLTGPLFKVELSNKHFVLARLCDKLRHRFIKLVAGDRVRVEMPSNDSTNARITSRL